VLRASSSSTRGVGARRHNFLHIPGALAREWTPAILIPAPEDSGVQLMHRFASVVRSERASVGQVLRLRRAWPGFGSANAPSFVRSLRQRSLLTAPTPPHRWRAAGAWIDGARRLATNSQA
jgi:hypothetical protein